MPGEPEPVRATAFNCPSPCCPSVAPAGAEEITNTVIAASASIAAVVPPSATSWSVPASYTPLPFRSTAMPVIAGSNWLPPTWPTADSTNASAPLPVLVRVKERTLPVDPAATVASPPSRAATATSSTSSTFSVTVLELTVVGVPPLSKVAVAVLLISDPARVPSAKAGVAIRVETAAAPPQARARRRRADVLSGMDCVLMKAFRAPSGKRRLTEAGRSSEVTRG